jgi:DNA-directed RNA polymerase specialized sigma24 family protein
VVLNKGPDPAPPPEEVCEVMDLVRIHGLMHAEVAEALGVSIGTVQRRLDRSLMLAES